jgi:hypothetical protein
MIVVPFISIVALLFLPADNEKLVNDSPTRALWTQESGPAVSTLAGTLYAICASVRNNLVHSCAGAACSVYTCAGG